MTELVRTKTLGIAYQLEPGDVLVTANQVTWLVADVQRSDHQVVVYTADLPFPWLFGRAEVVSYVQAGECAMVRTGSKVEHTHHWYPAVDRRRHAFPGAARPHLAGERERALCAETVEISGNPHMWLWPSCQGCWRAAKILTGSGQGGGLAS